MLALWVGTLSLAGTPAAAAFYSYPVGAGPLSIAAGDLNRDGRPDLVTANGASNSITVLLDRGAGRFERLPDLAVSSASQVAIADLNGDGIPDLAVAGAAVSVFPGNGDGTFGPRLVYADATYFNSVAVGDVNRDGRLDVVAAEAFDNVAVFPGHGDGTLGPPSYFLANPGGEPAAVPRVALPSASGPPWRIMKVVLPTGVAIADLDGDGWPDIEVSLDSPYDAAVLEILLANGDGTFRQAATFNGTDGRAIAVADFNRDGWPDLAVANPMVVSVVLNPANGTIGPASNLPTRSVPVGLAAGDLNGDGVTDLVSSNSPGEVCVWLGNGAGGFGAPAYYATSHDPNAVTIADLDGDGRADLATTDQNSNAVSVLFGDGAGRFGAPPAVGVSNAPVSLALDLGRIQPNPVRVQATIPFSLPRAGRVTLRVLDISGRLFATLEDGFLPAGGHVVPWDGRDRNGATATPGAYLCELRFEGKTVSRTLAVLR